MAPCSELLLFSLSAFRYLRVSDKRRVAANSYIA